MVILEKKPSGGYLTKGSDREGVIIIVVPGGRARRPSCVTQRILFCLVLPSSCGKQGDTIIFNISSTTLTDVCILLSVRCSII